MKPKNFCFEYSLQKGAKTVAIIYMFGTISVLIGLTVMMVEFENVFQPFVDWLITDIPQDVTEALKSTLSKAKKDSLGKSASNSQSLENKAATAASLRSVALVMGERAFLIIATVLHVLYMIPCVLLYVGTLKGVPRYMALWVTVELIRQLFVGMIYAFVIWCTWVVINKHLYDIAAPIALCVLMGLFMGVTFYFWVVVFAALKQVQAKGTEVNPE